jgi:hypothetical protein
MSRSKLNERERRVDEGCTAQYQTALKDETGATITTLTAVTLTLYDDSTGTIINSRTDQNVLNQNNVTFSGNTLAWTLQPADNIIVTTGVRTNSYEKHVALFEYTYDSGNKSGKHELEFSVRQLKKVS